MRTSKFTIAMLTALFMVLTVCAAFAAWIIISPVQTYTPDFKGINVYINRIVGADYESGGIDLTANQSWREEKDGSAVSKFTLYDARKKEEIAPVSVGNEITYSSGMTVTNGTNLKTDGKAVTVGSTYSVNGITVKIDTQYNIVGTYYKSGDNFITEGFGYDGIGNDYCYRSDDRCTFTNLILKYKTVDVGGTLYTIEDALATGGNATVKADTSFAGKNIADQVGYTQSDGNYTVKSGATLTLPYDTSKNTERKVGESGTKEYEAGVNATVNKYGSEASAREDPGNCDLTVTVAADTKITVDGSLKIGGITTGGNGGNANAGRTCSGYAKLVLGQNAVIKSNGVIEAYGFIEEETQNNNSQVILNGGSLKMPFVVVEHRGGTIFLSMLTASDRETGWMEGSPFNRFFLENVEPLLTIKRFASLLGYANLYANNKDNTATINLIGNVDSMLNIDGYVTAKFDRTSNKMKLDIYGDTTLNDLSLTLMKGFEIHTTCTMFPVSWMLNVNFHTLPGIDSASVTSSVQKFKILPGGQVTVDRGVTLNAPEMFVADGDYEDFPCPSSLPKYETFKEGGQLIVNGMLNVNAFGGCVKSVLDGAILNVTESNQSHTGEVKYKEGVTSSSAVDWEIYYQTLNGKTETSPDFAEYMQAGSYVSQNGVWVPFAIDYVFKLKTGDTITDIETEVINENAKTYRLAETYTLDKPPQCGGYIFIGWSFDENDSNLSPSFTIDGSKNTGHVKVYGFFEQTENQYTISFSATYEETPMQISKTFNVTKETIGNIDFNDPDIVGVVTKYDYDTAKQYYFDGWYFDKECEEEPYSPEKLAEKPYGEITLYAKFAQKYKLQIIVGYKNFKDEKTGEITTLQRNPRFIYAYQGKDNKEEKIDQYLFGSDQNQNDYNLIPKDDGSTMHYNNEGGDYFNDNFPQELYFKPGARVYIDITCNGKTRLQVNLNDQNTICYFMFTQTGTAQTEIRIEYSDNLTPYTKKEYP